MFRSTSDAGLRDSSAPSAGDFIAVGVGAVLAAVGRALVSGSLDDAGAAATRAAERARNPLARFIGRRIAEDAARAASMAAGRRALSLHLARLTAQRALSRVVPPLAAGSVVVGVARANRGLQPFTGSPGLGGSAMGPGGTVPFNP